MQRRGWNACSAWLIQAASLVPNWQFWNQTGSELFLTSLSKVKQDPKKEESLDDFINRFDAAHQDYAECGEVSAHLTITLFLNGLLPHLAEDIRVDIDSRPDWMRHHDIAPMESAKAITALSRLARSKKTRC